MGLQRVTAGFGEGRYQAGAVLGFDYVPAGVGEEALQASCLDVGDDPIEALPVEVYDHGEVGQPVGGRVRDRLPDVALVELGVTDGRDEPGRGPATEMAVEVAADQSREQWCDGSETH